MIYLYWTGGYDSTFRLCQLLVDERRAVQPIYLACAIDSRRNIKQEVDAIIRITNLIHRIFKPKDLFKTTMMVHKIQPNPEVTVIGRQLMKRFHLGHQYEKLCRYSINVDKPIEIGIILKDGGNANIRFFDEYLEGYGGECRVKSERPEYLDIYKNLRFPLMYMTKEDMRDRADKNGYLDILRETWSCRTPWEGNPCGRCPSCRERIV